MAGDPWGSGTGSGTGGGSGGTGGGKSGAKSLALPKLTTGQKANPLVANQKTWTSRTAGLLAKGYDFQKHIMPVIQADIQRVKGGSKGYSNLEAQALVQNLKSGKNPFKPAKRSGGFLGLGNVMNDVGQIVTGIIHVPEVIGGDLYKAGHMLLDPKYANQQLKKAGVKNPNDWSELNPLSSHFWDVASQLPVVRLMPGVYTGEAVAHSNWGDFQQHPVMHLLDVLPFISSGGKALTAGLDAGEEGSRLASLQQGKPLSALSKVPIFPTKTGLRSPSDLSKVVAKKIGVSKAVRETSRGMRIAERQAPMTGLAEHDKAWADIATKAKLRDDKLVEGNKALDRGDQAAADKAYKESKKAGREAERAVATHHSAAMAEGVHYGIQGVGVTRDDAVASIERDMKRGLYKSEVKGVPSDKWVKTVLSQKFVSLPKFATRFGMDGLSKDWLKEVVKQEYGVDAKEVFVPRWYDSAFRPLALDEKIKGSHVGNILDHTTDVFRYAVLTGPRHFAHILASNMMFMLGREGITPLRHFSQAWDMVRDPSKWVSDLARGLDTYNTDEIAGFKMGETLGRLWHEAKGIKKAGIVPEAGRMFEEIASDMFRAMSYLEEESKGKKIGLDDLAAHQQAVHALSKIYMDIDGLAPIERVILRRVIPFYSFERQLVSYMMRFPADFPARAAILSNIGRITMQDVGSQLPEDSANLFFLGEANAQGVANVLDVKNFNPFRTMAGDNPFTLAGFLTSLNPALRAPIVARYGAQSLFGSPDFYQQLSIDPYSGSYKVKQNPIDQFLGAAEQIIPELNSIDGLFQLSNNMKSLKSADPEAYRRLVFSSLNVPFVPYKYNQRKAQAQNLAKWYVVSKQDAANYMKDGNWASIKNYTQVPFGTSLVSPTQLEQLRTQVQQFQKTGS